MAVIDSPGTPLGQLAPNFLLPDTDGIEHRLYSLENAKAVVVYFTCNHCPYAVAWQKRLLDVASDYADRGVKVFAISSNDAEKYPADSFQRMRQRVEDEGWTHPYLYDESQEVARAFDAKTTPDIFLLDSEFKFCYRGAADSDYEDPQQNAAWLRNAIDAVLAGQEPQPAETSPVGCSIKWR